MPNSLQPEQVAGVMLGTLCRLEWEMAGYHPWSLQLRNEQRQLRVELVPTRTKRKLLKRVCHIQPTQDVTQWLMKWVKYSEEVTYMPSKCPQAGSDSMVIKIKKKNVATFSKWLRLDCKLKMKIFILFQFA